MLSVTSHVSACRCVGLYCVYLSSEVEYYSIIAGPQCVSRRTYSITTGGRRSQQFVAVEGAHVLTENTWSYFSVLSVFADLLFLSESSCVCLQCCGPSRSCSLKGYDSQGRQVFYFKRPFGVDACCLGCCLMEMRAYSPQNHLIGAACQR